MTRFHILMMATAVIAGLALAAGQTVVLAGVGVVFVMVTGVGVALPRVRLFGPFICGGDHTRRRVALTFDDGPDARSTPALLDLLREKQVTAAFFCIGKRVAAERELAARIFREGHLLENHTYEHSNFTNFFTTARLRVELEQTQAAIQAAAGTRPKYFRPPMGLSNLMVFQVARELKLQVVGWLARGLDTQISDPERIVRRIVRQLKPGAIILLHDGNIPAERLVVTVNLLLVKLHEHGYEVVRLDQMLT